MVYSDFFNLNKKIAGICAVLLGISMPISTGLDSLLLALLLLTTLTGWNSQYLRMIAKNPVAKTALLLFGILLIGCFYGAAHLSDSWKVLTKYDDLILVALLLPIFSHPQTRLYGQYAFMSAMGVTLILSYLIWLGALQHTSFFANRLADNPVVFKLHITHGILMGFAAFMFAVHALHTAGNKRWLMLAASIFAACNVLLMTQSRTGYLVIISLGIYLILSLLKWRGLLIGLCLAILLLGFANIMPEKIQTRIALAVHEAKIWKPMQGNNDASSIGTRMDFYTNTAKIIQKNPLIGTGTGGFAIAYTKEIEGTNMWHANNPHNQFLLFWAQTGIIGLSAFLLLLWVAWQVAARLPSPTEKMLARGLLITIITGSLFNSLLLDHTEGLFFAWFCGLLFAGLPNDKQTT